VQKSGDAVRVNVQLIKAVNDSPSVGRYFYRKLSDIFSVESEVAKHRRSVCARNSPVGEEQVSPLTDG